jgi:RNA polymerase sigma factor (sigma-70 family)
VGAATTSAPHEHDARAAAARTEELFAEYGRTVFGLCRALLRDSGEAEDAVQQTFLAAHRALLNGTRPHAAAAWLATIARNECWARISARMREPLPSAVLETEPGGVDPLVEALRRADLAALWQAIDALPRAQRDALLLREFGGLSYEELAAALDVTRPAVESLLFRARTRLRAAYAAVTGASWLDALARLLAGGGAPAAAKVAALGVGAAALGSGAVVVPRAFDNHRPSRAPVVAPHEPAAKPRHLRKPEPAPILVEHVAPARPRTTEPAAARLHRVVRHVEREPEREPEHAAQPLERSGGGGESRDGEQNRTRTLPLPAVTSDGSSGSGDGGDGRDGGGRDGGSDGGDGGGGSDDGGT